ncbi:MAG TPA: tape measure protein [Ignavibacteriales bacterium]|nr:tape measure protein [Ignavibacteriales bacterium]
MNEIGIKVTIDGKEGVISLDQLDKKFNQLNNTATRVKDSLFEKFSTQGAMLFTGLNQGLELAKKAFDFFSKPVTLAMDAEQAKVTFEVLLGSADAANKMIKQMKEDAAKTPLEFTDFQQAGKILLNFGVEADKLRGIMMMLGDVSGGDAQRFQQLALVFGQVASAGKLQGQDLLQLINAGFNPLQEISRTTGESMAKLKKDMEGGKISYDMVIGAFKSATSEGGRFNGMMDKQSLTLKGLLSTLSDNLDQAMVKFAESGLFEKIKGKVDDIGKWISENGDKIAEGLEKAGAVIGKVFDVIVKGASAIGQTIGFLWSYKEAILAVAIALGILTAAVNADTIALTAMYAWDTIVINAKKIWTAVQWALNAAMNANPVVLITAGVIAFLGILYTVIDKTIGWAKAWNYIKAALTIAWEYIKAFGTFVSNWVTGLVQLLTLPWQIMWNTASNILGKIGSIMKKLVVGDFAGIWDDIKSGFVQGFDDALKSTTESFAKAYNAFDGLGEKSAKLWSEAGKDATVQNTSGSSSGGQQTDPTNSNKKTAKELTSEEKKAAIADLDAKMKEEEAQAKKSTENELEREQKILDINRKYSLLKVQYEKDNAKEIAAEKNKINADYDSKQADLDNKKKKALLEQRKTELDIAWGTREAELKYNEQSDLEILKEKRLYLEMVRNLYTKGSKEWNDAQKDLNAIDWEIKTGERAKARRDEKTNKGIAAGRDRLNINQNDGYALDVFDENQKASQDQDDLKEQLRNNEITKEQFDALSEIREKEHQNRLLQIKKGAYDNWLGQLAGLSRQEIAAIKGIADNLGSTFGTIGDMVYNSAKRESDSYKETQKEKLKSDREKALSHARSQKDKDRINKQYDAAEKKMEDDADKRARDKAKDWYTVQKAASVASATVNTYEAADKALTAAPPPWNFILMGTVIAAGLANVASIVATPLPGFARGVVGINGPGTGTSDSIMARISKGESIITEESTKNASPLLRLMNGSASFAKWANDVIINGGGILPRYAAGMVGDAGRSLGASRPNISNLYVNDNGDILNKINANIRDLNKRPINLRIGNREIRVQVIETLSYLENQKG